MPFHGLVAILAGLFGSSESPALRAISLLRYQIEPPDILRIDVDGLPKKLPPIRGIHIVRPDGTVSFGTYGSVSVDGLTRVQVKVAVTEHLAGVVKKKHAGKFEVQVEVHTFNSKSCYVVTDIAAAKESVTRVPYTGNETVRAAISQIGGLASETSKRVWVSRPAPDGGKSQILPVDWPEICRGRTQTNYQLLPGDRVFVVDRATDK